MPHTSHTLLPADTHDARDRCRGGVACAVAGHQAARAVQRPIWCHLLGHLRELQAAAGGHWAQQRGSPPLRQLYVVHEVCCVCGWLLRTRLDEVTVGTRGLCLAPHRNVWGQLTPHGTRQGVRVWTTCTLDMCAQVLQLPSSLGLHLAVQWGRVFAVK